ncbi:MAG: toprim domain-containing protein [Oscillospiraceae bacterium]
MRIKLDAVLICEGKYDKIKLSSIFDTTVIITDGFAIFKDKEKLDLIKKLSFNKKIVIITDGDSAGFKIRNYIKNYLKSDNVYNVLIPDIYGKEKRKVNSSKEGKVGVEGISKDILIKLITNLNLDKTKDYKKILINKTDLYNIGLSGRENSTIKRKKLLYELNLPERTAPNTLLEILNILYTKEEFYNYLKL